MRLTIENKSTQEIFVAIFQVLKNWSTCINICFDKDRLYIQSIDKSHVCLAYIDIKSNWFTNYECIKPTKVTVDAQYFAVLMNYALKHDSIEIKFDNEIEPDKIYINFLNNKDIANKKGSYDHFFELKLIDLDEDGLEIPEVEYSVEFEIDTKKFIEVISELYTIGQNLNIVCNEDKVELNSNGDSAKLKVNIPINDLNEYAINEGEELNISFSLNHIYKMCCSLKIAPTIELSLSSEYPLSLKYKLGEDSKVVFFIAPKIYD